MTCPVDYTSYRPVNLNPWRPNVAEINNAYAAIATAASVAEVTAAAAAVVAVVVVDAAAVRNPAVAAAPR